MSECNMICRKNLVEITNTLIHLAYAAIISTYIII